MLSHILICLKKDNRSVKLLCDTLLDHGPDVGPNSKFLGADGENSILSQTCNIFPLAMLLCILHIEENINRNFPKNIPGNKKKNEFIEKIFGNDTAKGFPDSESIEECNDIISRFY